MSLVEALLDLLFPPTCISCGSHQIADSKIMLCQTCRGELEPISGPLCSCCGIPFTAATNNDHLCGLCLTNHFHFDRARAVLRYKPPLTEIISRFKYHGQRTGLKTFRALQQQSTHLTEPTHPELIIPVPLHRKRLQERGFNQALVLARTFYPDDRGIIDFLTLIRQRHTDPQTGLSGKARRRNLKNSFMVIDEEKVKGKRVILVDDVFTTGTTVSECARVLKKAGANKVDVLTLARVV
ncbi:MAG: ComF family protein [Thermodesulfobacteriota bacterium]